MTSQLALLIEFFICVAFSGAVAFFWILCELRKADKHSPVKGCYLNLSDLL